jgi:hypothetical protein
MCHLNKTRSANKFPSRTPPSFGGATLEETVFPGAIRRGIATGVFIRELDRAQLVGLLKEGAAIQDIHDSPAILIFAVSYGGTRPFIQRE